MVDLTTESQEARLQAFHGMLNGSSIPYTSPEGRYWHVRTTGVIGPDLPALQQQVCRWNNVRARYVRSFGGQWVKSKLILWRGCWCLAERNAERYKPDILPTWTYRLEEAVAPAQRWVSAFASLKPQPTPSPAGNRAQRRAAMKGKRS